MPQGLKKRKRTSMEKQRDMSQTLEQMQKHAAKAASLMKALGNAYEAGADAGTISDIEAYQTAYGLAIAARDIATRIRLEHFLWDQKK